MASPPRKPEPGSGFRQAFALTGVGIQFAVTVTLCTAGGWWLDERLNSSPWLLLAGALFGAVAAFYHLYRVLVSASEGQGGEPDKDDEES